MKKERNKNPIQPVSGTKVPRFAGPSTFARLPELRDVESCDVAIVGVPFDAGTSYRPGARFGPQSIRQASRHLRTNYHPSYDVEPFKVQQVADAGDITCNPFSIDEAIKQMDVEIKRLENEKEAAKVDSEMDEDDTRAMKAKSANTLTEVNANMNVSVNMFTQGGPAKFIFKERDVMTKIVKTDTPKSANGGCKVDAEEEIVQFNLLRDQ